MSSETCVACGTGEIELNKESCPECGAFALEAAEGCSICMSCGFSPCK